MHFTNDNIVLVFCQYLDPPMLQSKPISAVEGRCQNPERERIPKHSAEASQDIPAIAQDGLQIALL